MCDVCETLLKQIPAEAIAALETFSAEAEALGAKAIDKLVETGLIKMLPDTFTPEQIASGEDKRIGALYGLAAIAGFTVNNAIHSPDVAIGGDGIYEVSAQIGWAAGHVAATAVRN